MTRYADEYVRCIPAVCAGNVWRKVVVLRDTTCSVCVWGGVSVGVLYNPVRAPVALCCTPTYELMNFDKRWKN